jgi:hypothetical protein
VSHSDSFVILSTQAPPLLAAAGPRASHLFHEFFTAQIRNPHTRRAYARTATEFFAWLDARGVAALRRSRASILTIMYVQHIRSSRHAI